MPHASCMRHVRGCLVTATTKDMNHHEHRVELALMTCAIGMLQTDVPLPHFQLLLHVLEDFKSGGMFREKVIDQLKFFDSVVHPIVTLPTPAPMNVDSVPPPPPSPRKKRAPSVYPIPPTQICSSKRASTLLFDDVHFFSPSLREQLTASFSHNLGFRAIRNYHAPLQQILLSIHPSLNSSSFSTISSLQAALRAPEVVEALVRSYTRTRARTSSRTAFNRFLLILSLKVEETCAGIKELAVVKTASTEDEKEGGTGSEHEEAQEEWEDQEETGGGTPVVGVQTEPECLPLVPPVRRMAL